MQATTTHPEEFDFHVRQPTDYIDHLLGEIAYHKETIAKILDQTQRIETPTVGGDDGFDKALKSTYAAASIQGILTARMQGLENIERLWTQERSARERD